MIGWLLPDIQAMRSSVRALKLRAMWNLSHDRPEAAWGDVLACYRIGRHAARGPFMIHSLVGIACEAMADGGLYALLSDEDLSPQLLEQIDADLASLASPIPIKDLINETERFAGLDIAMRLASGRLSPDEFGMMGVTPLQAVSNVRVNWNLVLEGLNGWYDGFRDAASKPRLERIAALEEIDAEMQLLNPTKQPGKLLGSVVSMRARSEVVADVLAALLIPATSAALDAEDRAVMLRRLARIAVALRRYQSVNGAYPDELSALVPEYLDAIPVDLYGERDPVYQKKPDGFLLYSVFQNGTDDGGTGLSGRIVNGEYVSVRASTDFERSDLAVRLPLPRFRMPEIPIPVEYDGDELGFGGPYADEEDLDEEDLDDVGDTEEESGLGEEAEGSDGEDTGDSESDE